MKKVKPYINRIAFGSIHVLSYLGVRWLGWEEVMLTTTRI